jgi:hypothetical protein
LFAGAKVATFSEFSKCFVIFFLNYV